MMRAGREIGSARIPSWCITHSPMTLLQNLGDLSVGAISQIQTIPRIELHASIF